MHLCTPEFIVVLVERINYYNDYNPVGRIQQMGDND
jgi:hypothetical protein